MKSFIRFQMLIYLSTICAGNLMPTVSSSMTSDDPWDPIGHTHSHMPQGHVCPACLDTRLMRHYYKRGCEPVTLSHCTCPSRFKCPVNFDITTVKTEVDAVASGRLLASEDTAHCSYNGTLVPLGQIVNTEDVCRICVCTYLHDGKVGVDCETQIQCPEQKMLTGTLLGGNINYLSTSRQISPIGLSCYQYYEHDKCCPRQECVPVNRRTGRTLRPRKVCQYGGKQYKLGERIDLISVFDERENESIDSTEDHGKTVANHLLEELACINCICTESWNSTLFTNANKSQLRQLLYEQHESCKRKDCQLQFDNRFRVGCVPVYHEDKCCPVDFVCRK